MSLIVWSWENVNSKLIFHMWEYGMCKRDSAEFIDSKSKKEKRSKGVGGDLYEYIQRGEVKKRYIWLNCKLSLLLFSLVSEIKM